LTVDYDNKRRSDGESFHCPNGHKLSYKQTENDRLKKKIEGLEREVSRVREYSQIERNRRRATERSLAAQKGATTKIKKRVGRGQCIHCTETFSNLEQHMRENHVESIKNNKTKAKAL